MSLPDGSVGKHGIKYQLPFCIAVLGEFDFGVGLSDFSAGGIAFGPDLVQEITASHGVEDQLRLG